MTGILRAGGEVDRDLVPEGPDHDPVDPALEVLADVVGAFAAAHLDVGGGEVDGLAAEPDHARLEGHPRAQGGLLEDHGQDLVLERLAVLVGALLDLVGAVEHLAEFVDAQVADGQEIFLHRGSSWADATIRVPDRLSMADLRWESLVMRTSRPPASMYSMAARILGPIEPGGN